MEGGFFPTEELKRDRVVDDDSILLPLRKEDVCAHCGDVPILNEILKNFGIRVCNECRRTKLKFVTKTRSISHYLLSTEELKQFRFMYRPNPHRGSWNDMQLYLEEEINRYSQEKHGGLEGLERAQVERKSKSHNAKVIKIKKQVKNLKQKLFLKPKEAMHRHVFKVNGNKGRCECGMIVDMEEYKKEDEI